MRSKSGDGGGGGGEVVVNKDFRRGWEGVVRSWACLAVRFSHLLARLQTPLHKYQEGHDVSSFMREDLYLYTGNLNVDNSQAKLLRNHLVLNSDISFNKTESKRNLGLGWIGFVSPIQGLIYPFGTKPGYFLSIKLRANTKHRNTLEGTALTVVNPVEIPVSTNV